LTLSLSLTLAACSKPPEPVPTAVVTPLVVVAETATLPAPKQASTPVAHVVLSTQPFPCATPTTQPSVGNREHATLSAEAWQSYQTLLGIESICLPSGLGDMYLGTDWDNAVIHDGPGRMVRFDFADAATGGPVPASVLYSTYDFAIGAEYDTFATVADRDALRSGQMPDALVLNGRPAYVRFQEGGCFGSCVLKSIVFPFETDYVAVVYNLGEYDLQARDWDTVQESLRAGEYPEAHRAGIAQTDWLAQSMVFRER
jgi:hypothetical protein